MKATARRRITKHIARMIRRRLSEVLLVSIDGLEVSMMNSDIITTLHYMKMCTNAAVSPYHNISIGHDAFLEIRGEREYWTLK